MGALWGAGVRCPGFLQRFRPLSSTSSFSSSPPGPTGLRPSPPLMNCDRGHHQCIPGTLTYSPQCRRVTRSYIRTKVVGTVRYTRPLAYCVLNLTHVALLHVYYCKLYHPKFAIKRATQCAKRIPTCHDAQ